MFKVVVYCFTIGVIFISARRKFHMPGCKKMFCKQNPDPCLVVNRV